MPWETSTMSAQRSQFVLESKSKSFTHSELCRRYNICRKVGYKWLQRFDEEGISGLLDRSRRPKAKVSEVPHEVTTKIVAYRTAHPSWGATKIHKILKRDLKRTRIPSRRTIHRILQECNLVTTRVRHSRRKAPCNRVVLKANYANHIWTVDFKGWWRTKDGKKVFPLTIRDEYSKFILTIACLPSPSLDLVKEAFIDCFKSYGLPEYIRCDNGTPFSHSGGFCGLSRLSAWWLKIGVVPNFIPPASPQFNPGHERMHKDMKSDLQTNPARNLRQQQIAADSWREDFNTIRPHDSLADKTPASVYRRSRTKYNSAEPALEYPSSMIKRFVNKQGVFKFNGKKIFISKAIGQENIGIQFNTNNSADVFFAHLNIATTDSNFAQKLTEVDLITGLVYNNKIAA